MIHYFDEHEKPLSGPDGQAYCKAVETVEGVTIGLHHFQGVPAFATYKGLGLEEVHAYHAQRHPGLPYQLHAAPWCHFFGPEGDLKYSDHTRTLGDSAMIVEQWDAGGRRMGGTTYLMAEGEFEFAAEFGPEGDYYHGVDFGTGGDSVPIEELLPRLAALGLV